jgi:hypothetical protein
MGKQTYKLAVNYSFSEETLTKAAGILQTIGAIPPMSIEEIKQRYVDIDEEIIINADELNSKQAIELCAGFMVAIDMHDKESNNTTQS